MLYFTQFALWQHLKGFSFLCTEIYIIAKQLGHQPSIFGQLQEEIVMDDFINKVSVLFLSLYEVGLTYPVSFSYLG